MKGSFVGHQQVSQKDRCFEGERNPSSPVSNCIVSGKVTDGKEEGEGAETSDMSVTEIKMLWSQKKPSYPHKSHELSYTYSWRYLNIIYT